MLWLFLVIEFVGSSFGEWASLVSGALYLAAFVALAVTLWQTSRDSWETQRELSPFSEGSVVHTR